MEEKIKKEMYEKVMLKKINKLIEVASGFGLTIVAGVKRENSSLVSFCSDDFDPEGDENLSNIYLMIKSKGDLNSFMLAKSKLDTNQKSEGLLVNTNPQVLKTKH